MPPRQPLPANAIRVVGAREHNLRDVTVDIPRDDLVVITGLSGTGKSSLAFDTLYAEGQRRYVESLSAYARQFLGQMDKPDVDYIEGLSPAISIDQKTHQPQPALDGRHGHRDLRLPAPALRPRRQPHCPICGRPITGRASSRSPTRSWRCPRGTRFLVLAPLVRGPQGRVPRVIDHVRQEGFVARARRRRGARPRRRCRARQAKAAHHRGGRRPAGHARTAATSRSPTAWRRRRRWRGGLGRIEEALRDGDARRDVVFSEHFACPKHGIVMAELAPRTFSFNSPHGACPQCTGLGSREFDPELVVPGAEPVATGRVLPGPTGRPDYYDLLLGVDRRRSTARPGHAVAGAAGARSATLLLDGPRRRESPLPGHEAASAAAAGTGSRA